MKILKQGKSKKVFEADNTEYKYQFSQREGTEWWECKCPNCGKLTNKSIPTR